MTCRLTTDLEGDGRNEGKRRNDRKREMAAVITASVLTIVCAAFLSLPPLLPYTVHGAVFAAF